MRTAVRPFEGTFATDPVHSWFGFSVVFAGAGRYRGRFDAVDASLIGDDDGLVLAGAAAVESISIDEPAAFRERVLGPEFFDVANHPDVAFRSDRLDPADDGSLRVEGELTIAGVIESVVATGSWSAPAAAPGGALRAGLELEAVIDRRAFGLGWQMELPEGGDVLGWDVTLEVTLALVQAAPTS